MYVRVFMCVCVLSRRTGDVVLGLLCLFLLVLLTWMKNTLGPPPEDGGPAHVRVARCLVWGVATGQLYPQDCVCVWCGV